MINKYKQYYLNKYNSYQNININGNNKTNNYLKSTLNIFKKRKKLKKY